MCSKAGENIKDRGLEKEEQGNVGGWWEEKEEIKCSKIRKRN